MLDGRQVEEFGLTIAQTAMGVAVLLASTGLGAGLMLGLLPWFRRIGPTAAIVSGLIEPTRSRIFALRASRAITTTAMPQIAAGLSGGGRCPGRVPPLPVSVVWGRPGSYLL